MGFFIAYDMPNKDPSFFQMLYLIIAENQTIQGALITAFIAILRVLYDDNKTKPFRIFLEALICGALSLCVSGIVEFFNLPNSVVITIGGTIGFIGVTALRDCMLKLLDKGFDRK